MNLPLASHRPEYGENMQHRQKNILTKTSFYPVRCLSPVVICSGAALRGYAISPSPFSGCFIPAFSSPAAMLSPTAVQFSSNSSSCWMKTSVSVMRWAQCAARPSRRLRKRLPVLKVLLYGVKHCCQWGHPTDVCRNRQTGGTVGESVSEYHGADPRSRMP